MTPIEETDVAMVMVCGLEVLADEDDDQGLVCACKLVLAGLLDVRMQMPQQRPSPENGGPSCTDSPSTGSASPPC